MQLLVQKLDPGAKVPDYHYEHDAGLDLYALTDATLAPGERVSIPTGIAMAIPPGYVGLVWDKSGHSQKRGLKSLGGVIDSGYRGEILVGLINLSSESVTLPKHTSVAQLLIQKVEHVTVAETDTLDETQRGEKGFGSGSL